MNDPLTKIILLCQQIVARYEGIDLVGEYDRMDDMARKELAEEILRLAHSALPTE